ncbi:MAG: pyridoxamine 5'-phosphate oxidase family protein [Hyphomicrobiales bacterium]
MPREPYKTTNLDQYGGPAVPWSRAAAALDDTGDGSHTAWFLGVAGADGLPHAAGIGALWSNGEVFFVSGPGTRKSRALAQQPGATMSARLDGIDIVLEGNARRITDRPTLEKVAALYRAAGWPAEVDGEAFTAPYTAPSGGPPPWNVYSLDYHTVYGVSTAEPYGATRWQFDQG